MHVVYNDIISLPNLFHAWREFVRGKKFKPDVAELALNLSANIYELHQDLKSKTYRHGPYQSFSINDPKPRSIHKATVRDRLLHHAIYRQLYLHFERVFIYDSYSCRISKGTHRALERFRILVYQISQRHTKTTWVLKCDIKKFFASINQEILLEILWSWLPDQNVILLLERVISSFHSGQPGIGLPLGNLTSQLLVNIYLNEFDQFVKHELKVKHYLRYADDFVVISHDRVYLNSVLPLMRDFLGNTLKLSMHPNKISISTVASGVDFLGWVHFPDHRVLRTATKRRMLRKIAESKRPETLNSYLGMLRWGNGRKLQSFLSPFGLN